MWRVLLLATLAAIRADEATFEDFGALARQELSSDEVPFGEDVAITVGEGQWWHGHVRTFGLHAAPLDVEIRVLRASDCSEGSNPDGSCTFGLKVFGALGDWSGVVHALPTPEAPRHGSGEPYKLHMPACALGDATRLFLGVWGWDGTSELTLRATQGVYNARSRRIYAARRRRHRRRERKELARESRRTARAVASRSP
jgi:hypothetical protein